MEHEVKVEKRLNEQRKEVYIKLEEQGIRLGFDYCFEGIYLQGSQNYNTHHQGSDVDSKLVIVPTVRSMLLGKKLSHEISLDNGEKCSVKPVMDFVDLFWKGNINNLEILTTQYKIVKNNSFIERLIGHESYQCIPEYVKGTLWDASIGMMIQKQKSMFKGTETTKPYVEKYGFDNKDFIHIMRIHDMLLNISQGKSFSESLDFSGSWYYGKMLEVREGVVSKTTAEQLAKDLIYSAELMKEEYCPKNVENLQTYKDEIREWYANYYEGAYL